MHGRQRVCLEKLARKQAEQEKEDSVATTENSDNCEEEEIDEEDINDMALHATRYF